MANIDSNEFYLFDAFSAVNLGEEFSLNIKDPAVINKRNAEGWTLLMYACSSGNRKIVEQLIAKGASLEHHGQNNKTPVMLAIGSGDFTIVKHVFHLEDLEVADDRGWTALFYAVFYGREIYAEYLLLQGANVHAVDKFGQTPIHLAVKSGMESMVALLLRGAESHNTSGSPCAPHHDQTGSPGIPSPLLAPPRGTPPGTPKQRFTIFKPTHTFSPNKRTPRGSNKENAPPKAERPSTPGPIRPKVPKLNFGGLEGGSPSRMTPTTPKREVLSPMGVHESSNMLPMGPSSPGLRKTPRIRLESPLSKVKPAPTVELFLAALGLEKYVSIFKNEEVDFDTLMTFEEENLREIGISLYGPRRKIAMAIQEYQQAHSSGTGLLKSSIWLKSLLALASALEQEKKSIGVEEAREIGQQAQLIRRYHRQLVTIEQRYVSLLYGPTNVEEDEGLHCTFPFKAPSRQGKKGVFDFNRLLTSRVAYMLPMQIPAAS